MLEAIKKQAMIELKDVFNCLDQIEAYYSSKILKLFTEEQVRIQDLNGTTGYGFNYDVRDKLERIYSKLFGSERTLLRSQMISGTHALSLSFFGDLKLGDVLLSISGKPYDTLDKVIGYYTHTSESLISMGIKYASYILDKLGYKVLKTYNKESSDIFLAIEFNDYQKMINFIQEIQSNSAIDSFGLLEPGDMVGYASKIIMASGSFISGSSIELSCDGPLRPPYVVYLQGSVTFVYGIAIYKSVERLIHNV